MYHMQISFHFGNKKYDATLINFSNIEEKHLLNKT